MKWWDWFWHNKEGKIVVWQSPNFLLTGWAICRILAYLLDNRSAQTTLSIAGTIFLTGWAIMEIIKGDSPFRKILGSLILIMIVYSQF